MPRKRVSIEERRAVLQAAWRDVGEIYKDIRNVDGILATTYGPWLCRWLAHFEKALVLVSARMRDAARGLALTLEDHGAAAVIGDVGEARHELAGEFVASTNQPWPPLSAPEHHALGLRLRRCKSRLAHLATNTANAFGRSSSSGGIAYGCVSALSRLNRLCCALDSIAHRDCPEHGEAPPASQGGLGPARSWYYGAVRLP